MQLQDQEDAIYSEQIILDEEIELKKKIALYYHPMVCQITNILMPIMFLNIVSKLFITMVCSFAIRELPKAEQEAIHGVECPHIKESHS